MINIGTTLFNRTGSQHRLRSPQHTDRLNYQHNIQGQRRLQGSQCRRIRLRCAEREPEKGASAKSIVDINALQTELNSAIAAENYAQAAQIRDKLVKVVGSDAKLDWTELGVPEWLADRLSRLGFPHPMDIQRRALHTLKQGNDVIIKSQTGSGKTLAFLVHMLTLLDYPPIIQPHQLPGPQGVVVVPTMELGVQVALLVYRLFGGTISAGLPGNKANMYTYKGPRGIIVRGVLSEKEVKWACENEYLRGVHVVVTTPESLTQMEFSGTTCNELNYAKFVVLDEADAILDAYPNLMDRIMYKAGLSTGSAAQVALVGATISQKQANAAISAGWMQQATIVDPLEGVSMPPNLVHRLAVVPVDSMEYRMAVLTRQIRDDIQSEGDDKGCARMMVFCNDEESALQVSSPLRKALWGVHRTSMIIPSGEEPILALQSFRDNASSLLLATPSSARGLDLPAISYVYNMSPPSDVCDYIHRAGRAGRLGSPVGGVVTTIVSDAEAKELEGLAELLGVTFEYVGGEVEVMEVVEGQSGDISKVRQKLEDLYYLFGKSGEGEAAGGVGGVEGRLEELLSSVEEEKGGDEQEGEEGAEGGGQEGAEGGGDGEGKKE